MTPEQAHAELEAMIADGRLDRQTEATAITHHVDNDGRVNWPAVYAILGPPRPVTFWNKFGG